MEKKEYNFKHKSKKPYYRDFTGLCRIVKDDGDTILVEFRNHYVIPRGLNQKLVMRVYCEDLSGDITEHITFGDGCYECGEQMEIEQKFITNPPTQL